MKIKLYQVYADKYEEELKPLDLEIKGKMIYLFKEPDSETHMGCVNTRRLFSCEYNTDYAKAYKKIKLNHFIKIYPEHPDDASEIAGLSGFTYLNFFEKLRMNWNFQQTWIQKSENIKWLASIPISILTAYITAKLTK